MQLRKFSGQQLDICGKGEHMTTVTDRGHRVQSGYHAGNVTAGNKHKNHKCNKNSDDIVVRQSFIHNNYTKLNTTVAGLYMYWMTKWGYDIRKRQ